MVLESVPRRAIGLAVIVAASVLTACGGTAEPAQEPEAVAPAEEAAPAQEVPAEGAGPEAPAAPPPEEMPAAPGAEEAAPGSCVETNPHPIAQSIADTYETATYEQVITWFCAGSTFDDILLALETNAQTGMPVEELLAMRAAGTEWEQIWEAIGFVEPPE